MSSRLRQLETARTLSPLRKDWTNRTPGAPATTSCSCCTSSSDSRSIAPGRAVASRMRKIAIPAPIGGGRAPQEVPGAAEDVARATNSVGPAADGRRSQPELNHARRAATALVDDGDGDLSGGAPGGRG